MNILHERKEATAAEVQERLPKAPSYSATRALLRILEEKGHITHAEQGPRYVFPPVESQQQARKKALRNFLKTFCHDSAEEMVAALIDYRPGKEELERLSRVIAQAKKGVDCHGGTKLCGDGACRARGLVRATPVAEFSARGGSRRKRCARHFPRCVLFERHIFRRRQNLLMPRLAFFLTRWLVGHSRLRELACDEAALSSGIKASTHAETLLALAGGRQPPFAVAAVGASDRPRW